MEKIRSIRLRKLHGRLDEVIYELTRVQFSHSYSAENWSPAINAYRCRDCIMICFDLAGVDKSAIDLRIERRRLSMRGQRKPPEPEGERYQTVQVLALEIDYGPFERVIDLPQDVDPDRVTAEQRNGLLWVFLPLRSEG
jgi:HSP20 family protein